MRVLGYSPFDSPYSNPIGPFNTHFTACVNLVHKKDLSGIDAVLLWGGADISPLLYGEEPITEVKSGPATPTDRDLFEWELLRLAKQQKKPIIGVCRGAQLICAFAGGHLIQHIDGHEGYHNVTTYDGQILNCSSSHHQMMYPYNLDKDEYTLLAWTDKRSNTYLPEGKVYTGNMDKRIYKEPEVVYFNKLNAMAIQCHPEWHSMTAYNFNAWLLNNIQHFMLK